MAIKDYKPIKFEFFQSDMEKIMDALNTDIDAAEEHDCMCIVDDLKKLKRTIQHKIDQHIQRGEWV